METKIKQYHIFTDSEDDWTDDYEAALMTYHEYAGRNGCARLYVETYESQEDCANCDYANEECLMSVGDYPL